MDNRAIGVFDSGVGGLSAVRLLLEKAPHENIVYFGDTANVPYGCRSAEEIASLSVRDMRYMRSHDLKCVLIACNTITSVCGELLKQENSDIPVFGVIASAAAAAFSSKNGKIALMATEATVRSGEYIRQIKKMSPEADVAAVSCPKLVPLIEGGHISADDEAIRAALEEYLAPVIASGADTLILGCTHYPLIAPLIRAKLGEAVTLIDSGAVSALALLHKLEMTASFADKEQCGTASFFCSAEKKSFAKVAELFLGRDISDTLSQINISDY